MLSVDGYRAMAKCDAFSHTLCWICGIKPAAQSSRAVTAAAADALPGIPCRNTASGATIDTASRLEKVADPVMAAQRIVFRDEIADGQIILVGAPGELQDHCAAPQQLMTLLAAFLC